MTFGVRDHFSCRPSWAQGKMWTNLQRANYCLPPRVFVVFFIVVVARLMLLALSFAEGFMWKIDSICEFQAKCRYYTRQLPYIWGIIFRFMFWVVFANWRILIIAMVFILHMITRKCWDEWIMTNTVRT